MFSYLRGLYHRQMFYPGVIAIFINPFYFARKGLVSAISELAHGIHGDLLDIGCGTEPYRRLFNVQSYTGLDIDSPLSRERGIADQLYDGKNFPYADCTYDSAICNQVLEHVFDPKGFLSEIYRVLKPGGQLLLSVPFVWDEHEQPYDYGRYSSFGLAFLLQQCGFSVIVHKKTASDATAIFQLINAYLFKISQKWPFLLNHLFTITVIAAVNVLGSIFGKLLPDNMDLFLDNVVLAERKHD